MSTQPARLPPAARPAGDGHPGPGTQTELDAHIARLVADTPVWMTLHGGHGPMRLIDLADALPDPWRTAGEQEERQRHNRDDLDPYQ